MDNRSLFEIKADAVARLAMHGPLSQLFSIYTVTEYQKSGGTWVGQMISDYVGIPFPRNRFPVLQNSVLHGHLLPRPLMSNVVCVFRDGRDAIVSSYFHMLFESDKNIKSLVEKCRKDLAFHDYDDVTYNLPKFIEYVFDVHHKRTIWRQNQFTWNEFADSWWDKNGVVKVKYEDLIDDCFQEMERVLFELLGVSVDESRLKMVVDKFSFEKQSKRKPGDEDRKSFLRKGKPGDWVEKFNLEAAEVFDFYAGEQLITLGYETDKSWITGIKDTD